MVMPSSIPRLLAGPCLSVIFPPLSSIFLTSPLIGELCATAAVANKVAISAAPAMRLNCFIVYSFFVGSHCTVVWPTLRSVALLEDLSAPLLHLHPLHL